MDVKREGLQKYISTGIILVCIILFSLRMEGQVRFGFKGGLSTYDLGVTNPLDVINDGSDFRLNVEDSKYGYHFGILLQAKFSSFLIQPEIIFNSNAVDYTFQEVTNGSPGAIFSEKYQHLDIPILFGLKAGPLRLMAGPVGHYFLNSTSDLLDLESYQQRFDDLTYGWEAGIGVDLLNLMLDVRYEGNFSKFGDHIVFSGQRFAFDNTPTRLLASLAITIK